MTATIRPKVLASLAILLLILSSLTLVATVTAQETAPLWQVSGSVQSEDATAGQAEVPAELISPDGKLRFDVAEDMGRFVFAAQPVHEDGMPAHGNAFITQGYIYPAGTLTESNGVNRDGSPEFPELVLGEWTCRGWFVGEGAHATSGPWVITTQLYGFGDGLGDATLVSEGYELADVGVVIERAITGGTGPYAGARGEAEQTFLGFNATEGVNLTFAIDVTGVSQPVTSSSTQAGGYS